MTCRATLCNALCPCICIYRQSAAPTEKNPAQVESQYGHRKKVSMDRKKVSMDTEKKVLNLLLQWLNLRLALVTVHSNIVAHFSWNNLVIIPLVTKAFVLFYGSF